MKKLLLSILFVFLGFAAACAQNAVRADKLFLDGAYADALPIYQALHRRDASSVLFTYRLARCEQELGMADEAIRHFEEAGDKYPLRNFYLGELYYANYRFSEAQDAYADYLDAIDEEHEKYGYVTEKMRLAERAQRYLQKMEDVAIIDTVSFFANDILSYLPKLSADAGQIGVSAGLFSHTNQRADRRYLTVRDENGRTLICKQERLLDVWGAIDTLPAIINQNDEQNFPFLLPDGMTLYYASNSTTGLGGWDVYRTKYNPSSDSYSRPEIVNMPINSTENDFLYIEDETRGMGYCVTSRKRIPGKLTLFTFLLSGDHKPVTATDKEKRNLVRLIVLSKRQETVEDEDEQPVTIFKEQPQPDFTIIINDSVVFHTLADFPTEESRQLAQSYLSLNEEIEELTSELQARRLAYKNSESAEEKETLRPLILALEKDLVRLKKESAYEIKSLRQSLR